MRLLCRATHALAHAQEHLYALHAVAHTTVCGHRDVCACGGEALEDGFARSVRMRRRESVQVEGGPILVSHTQGIAIGSDDEAPIVAVPQGYLREGPPHRDFLRPTHQGAIPGVLPLTRRDPYGPRRDILVGLVNGRNEQIIQPDVLVVVPASRQLRPVEVPARCYGVAFACGLLATGDEGGDEFVPQADVVVQRGQHPQDVVLLTINPWPVVGAMEAKNGAHGTKLGPPHKISRITEGVAATVGVHIGLEAMEARVDRGLQSGLQRHIVASPPDGIAMLRWALPVADGVGPFLPVGLSKLREGDWASAPGPVVLVALIPIEVRHRRPVHM
mmetsp:Transcript_120267/g.256699  ORF Transcript_120267/g.256699 Transcript_120267/m.256699 type:complete len:331 (+) Transcript_120267:494-1486(+)